MHDLDLDGTRPDGRLTERVVERGPAAASPTAESAAGHGPAGPLDVRSILHLQRTAGNGAVAQLLEDDRSPVLDVVGTGGGSRLDRDTRSTMETAFGTSFDHVRIHSDERASRSAEAVGANAYTVGSDIVFRSGHFSPGTPTGQRTLAHELAHVVQQSQGPVDGTDAPGGIRLSHPSDRFERAADQTAGDVLSRLPAPAPTPAAPAAPAPAVQLEAEEGAVIQRTEVPVEEDELPGT
jgi:hypothetical protein